MSDFVWLLSELLLELLLELLFTGFNCVLKSNSVKAADAYCC